MVPTFLTLASANTVVNLASHPTKGRSPRPGEVENVTYATGQLGEKVTAADYVRATQTAHRLGRQMAAFHETYDVLLTPGARDTAAEARVDRHDDGRRPRVLAPGLPFLALHGVVQPDRPAGDRPAARAMQRHAEGTATFPVSVQLVARYGDEATLSDWPGS